MALEQALAKFEEGQLDASNYESRLNQMTAIMNWAAGGGFRSDLFPLIIMSRQPKNPAPNRKTQPQANPKPLCEHIEKGHTVPRPPSSKPKK
jgi:hypothetical protein